MMPQGGPLPYGPAPEAVSQSRISQSEPRAPLSPVKIYPYGVARNRLMQAAKRLGVPATVGLKLLMGYRFSY